MTQEGSRDNGPGGTQRQQDEGRSIAEWTTLAISAAILLAIVGMITWLSFNGSEEPARIVVEAKMDEVRQEESGYYLPVVVRNEGDLTVEDAVIEGELDTGSGEPQTAEITVTFLAGSEEISGTLVFEDDPRSGDFAVGVTSYKEP